MLPKRASSQRGLPSRGESQLSLLTTSKACAINAAKLIRFSSDRLEVQRTLPWQVAPLAPLTASRLVVNNSYLDDDAADALIVEIE